MVLKINNGGRECLFGSYFNLLYYLVNDEPKQQMIFNQLSVFI